MQAPGAAGRVVNTVQTKTKSVDRHIDRAAPQRFMQAPAAAGNVAKKQKNAQKTFQLIDELTELRPSLEIASLKNPGRLVPRLEDTGSSLILKKQETYFAT